MCANNLPKVATQWNSGATRDWNPGHRARIPSAVTTTPLSLLYKSKQWSNAALLRVVVNLLYTMLLLQVEQQIHS